MVGPVAIDQGRDRYNQIIESTSKEQTFANILRVYHHEPTNFMDVTEVDATTTLSGAATGGATNIGARVGTSGGTLAGQTESVTGAVTYSESPLIRYQPLLGQALVAQLATPVSADALVSLFDSSWNIMPLIDLSTAYLTPDFLEFYLALNVIAELNDDEAVAMVATKSDLTKEQDSSKNDQNENAGGDNNASKKNKKTVQKPPPPQVTVEVTNKPAGTGGNDTVVIYLNPFRAPLDPSKRRRELELWIRLLQLYSGTQKNSPPQTAPRCPTQLTEIALKQFDRDLRSANAAYVRHVRDCLPNFIELRTMPVKVPQSQQAGLLSGAPLLRTYSGLGILKNATEEPYPRIGFVKPDQYLRIRSYPWNQQAERFNFYTLAPETVNAGDYPKSEPAGSNDVGIVREVTNWLSDNASAPFVYTPGDNNFDGEDYVEGNRALGLLRRYILIIHGANAPANAYVAHFDHGEWYYIDADDVVSQKNFDLVSLFTTMMAVPSATPPLSPTLNVGGM
jgi:hypothetical protein